MTKPIDRELEQYRNLLDTPKEFKDGFGWSTIAGILFCGLVMLPGSIYLSLMTGGSMGAAGTWVTLILFAEISRRAMKTMSAQELVVFRHAAGVMIAANTMFPGGPFGHFVYRAYMVTSEAIRDAGMRDAFPKWFVPPPDSPAILQRDFFHQDWLAPIGLLVFLTVVGIIKRNTLGYFFFRLTSDIEKLPFPFAPISAQGAMALAEAHDSEKQTDANNKRVEPGDESAKDIRTEQGVIHAPPRKSKWSLFTLGASLGIAFGFFQVGIPSITGVLFEKPIFLIPQPFVETTVLTERILPATPTGIVFDLGIVLTALVIPFFAVIGTLIAIIATMIVNPILYHTGVLTKWQPGMGTVDTTFANTLDFWMSFGIGANLAISVISIGALALDIRAKVKKSRDAENRFSRKDLFAVPNTGRGDFPLWLALLAYIVAASAVIYVCHLTVPQLPVSFLIFFSFVFNPFVSYVNARLQGINGQSIDIPFVKESAFILTGQKGINIWLAPIPIEDYGGTAQSFRVNELTGVKLWSNLKADLVAIPILFVLSMFFWAFIWNANPVPSHLFPAAQIRWELQARQNALLYSSTFVPPGEEDSGRSIMDSEFMRALHPKVITTSFAFTTILYGLLSAFGLPVMLVYGIIRGLGDLPHGFVLEMVGALIGRYYYQKKFGSDNFLRMAPIIIAGYFTGVGLIGMATIAMKLIKEAVTSAPF